MRPRFQSRLIPHVDDVTEVSVSHSVSRCYPRCKISQADYVQYDHCQYS